MVDQIVARTLVELADTLVDDFDIIDLLTLLTRCSVEAFEVDAAGLMLEAPTSAVLRVVASSSEASRDLELLELQASEGPCLDAYHSGAVIQNGDIAAALEQWPTFAAAALSAGFRSVTAVPMRLRGSTIGALNLFRTSLGFLPESELALAVAFADVATIAVLQDWAMRDAQILHAQLTHALNSRVVIEQAKGMLAERADIDVSEAFEWLRSYARSHNTKLSELAARFLEGGISRDEIGPPRSL